MLLSVFVVGFGGALGAIARYCIQLLAQMQGWSPWGTFLVNVLGCFLIGLLVTQLDNIAWLRGYGRHLFVIGFLGAFTTFSAFSLDTLNLFQEGRLIQGFTYAFLTFGACLLATWIGMKVTANYA